MWENMWTGVIYVRGWKKDRGTNREVEVEWDTREVMNTSNGRLHYKVAISSWEECDPSGLQ